MVPVISQTEWIKWCKTKLLPVDGARFALETCYYGDGLRTRPGTLLLTDTELIHYSYSWRDTLWAILEPSVKISVPLQSLREVKRFKLNTWQRFYQAMPESAFQAVTHEGQVHHLVLQRRGVEFEQAIRVLGIDSSNDTSAA